MKYRGDSNNPLWHGIKLENAVKVLESGIIEARTTQRYWLDGRIRKDDSSDYETSKIMKGWSMSRDFYFAGAWSGVVLENDKDRLRNKFKIIPMVWNYTIGRGAKPDHKKGREEFVLARKTGKSFDQLIED